MVAVIAFITFMIGSVTFSAMSIPFIRAMRAEVPQLYSSFASPTVAGYIWRKAIFMPYSKFLLLRSYSHSLKNAPESRRWAGRLFWVHWVQLIALALFGIEVLRTWFHF